MNGSARRIEITAQHANEGGFAGTIGTDYAVAVAGSEFEINIREKYTLAKLNGKIRNSYHKQKRE